MVDYHDLHSNSNCTCPKCRGSSYAPSRGSSTKSGSGKKILAGILIAVIALGAGGFFLFPRLGLFSTSPQTPSSPASTPANTQTPPQNEAPKPIAEQPKVTQPITTEQAPPAQTLKTINNQILTKQLTMYSKDLQEISATVPDRNKGVVEAKIIPEKSGILEVTFHKNSVAYCANQDPGSCVFNVTGTDTASQKVDIPVKTGDVISAIIRNKSPGFLQQLTVVFVVSYDEVASIPQPTVPREIVTPNPVEPQQTYDTTGKPVIDTVALEKQIHALINKYRTTNGLTSLTFDEKLADVARNHSLDMAKNNYFEHDNLQGQDPSARAAAAAYSCYKVLEGGYYRNGIGENIMQSWLYGSVTYYDGIPSYNWWTQDQMAKDIAQGWWESPGHKANILTADYDRHGIGVAIADDGKVYSTDDFC